MTADWTPADWFAATVTAAALALLVVVLVIGDSWPGSEVVIVLALLGAGPGVALLLPRRPAVDEGETEETEEVEQR